MHLLFNVFNRKCETASSHHNINLYEKQSRVVEWKMSPIVIKSKMENV